MWRKGEVKDRSSFAWLTDLTIQRIMTFTLSFSIRISVRLSTKTHHLDPHTTEMGLREKSGTVCIYFPVLSISVFLVWKTVSSEITYPYLARDAKKASHSRHPEQKWREELDITKLRSTTPLPGTHSVVPLAFADILSFNFVDIIWIILLHIHSNSSPNPKPLGPHSAPLETPNEQWGNIKEPADCSGCFVSQLDLDSQESPGLMAGFPSAGSEEIANSLSPLSNFTSASPLPVSDRALLLRHCEIRSQMWYFPLPPPNLSLVHNYICLRPPQQRRAVRLCATTSSPANNGALAFPVISTILPPTRIGLRSSETCSAPSWPSRGFPDLLTNFIKKQSALTHSSSSAGV